MNDSQTAHVRITRTSDKDVQQRQVIVSVGDDLKATLLFGQSVEWKIPAGDHVLKANNTLVWKKVPFTAAAGDQVSFQIANRASRFTLGFLSLMGVAPLYMTIERQ
jgi:hypothetical protein